MQFDSFVLEIISELQVVTPTHQLVITENRVPLLTADPSRLSQVITNLVTNAVKYSPQASEVQIAVKEADGMTVCSIRDFGIGIHSKEHRQVFERFHQAHKNSNAGLSLGLGLYIAKEIIEEAGGKVWLESEVGEGSTFYFSLPLIS